MTVPAMTVAVRGPASVLTVPGVMSAIIVTVVPRPARGR